MILKKNYLIVCTVFVYYNTQPLDSTETQMGFAYLCYLEISATQDFIIILSSHWPTLDVKWPPVLFPNHPVLYPYNSVFLTVDSFCLCAIQGIAKMIGTTKICDNKILLSSPILKTDQLLTDCAGKRSKAI